MHHMIPRLALASALVTALAMGCDGGDTEIGRPSSPFQGYPADQQNNPGAIFHVPDPEVGSGSSEGGGGSNNNPTGGGAGTSSNGGSAGTGNTSGGFCDKCSALAKCGLSQSQCEAACADVSAACVSCINNLSSCNDLAGCSAACNGGGNGEAGSGNGEAGSGNGEAGSGNTGGDGKICDQCANIDSCTNGQLSEAQCEANCDGGVPQACADCINDAGSDCDTLVACFSAPECQ